MKVILVFSFRIVQLDIVGDIKNSFKKIYMLQNFWHFKKLLFHALYLNPVNQIITLLLKCIIQYFNEK